MKEDKMKDDYIKKVALVTGGAILGICGYKAYKSNEKKKYLNSAAGLDDEIEEEFDVTIEDNENDYDVKVDIEKDDETKLSATFTHKPKKSSVIKHDGGGNEEERED